MLALINGVVWHRGSPATALAVDGDRIVAIGADDEIRSLLPSGSKVIDARGSTILPAFNDAHVHFLMASRSLGELDLFGAETQGEVERRVMEYARTHSGPWIVGRGWFYSAFPGGMPSVELIDRLVPDRPAYFESFDAHTGWANTRALEIAGWQGSGVLKEAAMLGVTRHIPRRTQAEDLDALRAGLKLAASRGIASVQEAGDGLDQLPLWDSLRKGGELTLRVRLAFDMVPGLDARAWKSRLDIYETAARTDDWISTGILKAFADGVVESRTAALREPYPGTSDRGSPLWDADDLAHAVHAADARGWQVQVHAIGDAAIGQALDAFEGTTAGRRHRVEHIEAPAASDIPRFARLGVIASMQPQHAEPSLLRVWRQNLGPERAANGWPWRSILQSGARLAFGTDWPVVPLDPFASLRVATDRHTAHRLSLDEAISAWTSGSSYAEHTDHQKGELREGMLADITICDLEHDVVSATVVGGRFVYER